ncbi:hypothetical protein EON65_34705 [archaeon]|nr:MAG: hypothetical protein EON65_34705 [archaeon]
MYSPSVVPAPASNSSNGRIFHVQFKGTVRHFILGSQAPPNIPVGEFVVVEADRGEDVGIVTDILSMKAFIEMRHMLKHSVDEEDSTIGRIVRVASASERQQLKAKTHDEQSVMQVCCFSFHNPLSL